MKRSLIQVTMVAVTNEAVTDTSDHGRYGDLINAHTKKAHTKIPHRKEPHSYKCSHEKYPHGLMLTQESTHIEMFSHSQYYQVIHS
jgi:hypothetical protein